MGPLTRTLLEQQEPPSRPLWGKGSMKNELTGVVLRALAVLMIAVMLGVAWGILGAVLWAMHH